MARKPQASFDNVEMWLKHGVDLQSRSIMLDDDVDDYSVGSLVRGIKVLEKLSTDQPITVYINTYGGSCYDGLALYDVLRASPCHIRTIGIGKVMSMGTWLMLAGDERLAYPNTTFMWHTLSMGTSGKLMDVEVESAEGKRLYEVLLDILASRSSQNKVFWQKWLKHVDRYGDVKKALSLGFIDGIIEIV